MGEFKREIDDPLSPSAAPCSRPFSPMFRYLVRQSRTLFVWSRFGWFLRGCGTKFFGIVRCWSYLMVWVWSEPCAIHFGANSIIEREVDFLLWFIMFILWLILLVCVLIIDWRLIYFHIALFRFLWNYNFNKFDFAHSSMFHHPFGKVAFFLVDWFTNEFIVMVASFILIKWFCGNIKDVIVVIFVLWHLTFETRERTV